MGADLYLRSVHDKVRAKYNPLFEAAVVARDKLKRDTPAFDEAQKKVDAAYNKLFGKGYFRDSYNSFGLFRNLKGDWSWWRDIIPLLVDGNLPVEKAKELRAKLAETPIVLGPTVLDAAVKGLDSYPMKSEEEVATLLKEQAAAGYTPAQQKRIATTVKRYQSWRKELLDILDLSIKLNEPLDCSL